MVTNLLVWLQIKFRALMRTDCCDSLLRICLQLISLFSTTLNVRKPSPSQRPSFEHTGLTCYTLLSPSITFSLFHSELKTYLFRKSYPPS